jgi:ubiquinone/menaquinone biosynthesis C-methylase UbiE
MTEEFDNFDEHADNYRSVHNKNLKFLGSDSAYFTRYKADLLKRFETDGQLRLLDLGCGDGLAEIRMKQNFPQWKINGIEVSSRFIQQCRDLHLADVEFDVYDGKTIPFADASFDLVFIATVLHHIAESNHAALMQEISRVLKKGGRVYIFEHNPLNPMTRYLVATCEFDRDAVLLRKKYLAKLLKQEGFTISHEGYMTFVPPKKIFSFLTPLEKYLTWLPLGGQYFLGAVKK